MHELKPVPNAGSYTFKEKFIDQYRQWTDFEEFSSALRTGMRKRHTDQCLNGLK